MKKLVSLFSLLLSLSILTDAYGSNHSTGSEFSPENYINAYPDLENAFGLMKPNERDNALRKHYYTSGRQNNRVALPASFNPLIYLAIYNDLREAIHNKPGEDVKAWATRHFCFSGSKNNRQYLPLGFDAGWYLNSNLSLRELTSNMRDPIGYALYHYTNIGFFEGREYAPGKSLAVDHLLIVRIQATEDEKVRKQIAHAQRQALEQAQAQVRGQEQANAQQKVEIRMRHNEYTVPCIVNGKACKFIYDTGATETTIPYELCTRLGINTSNLRFNVLTGTANGETYSAHCYVSSFQITGLRNVGRLLVSISSRGCLSEPLLGMDVINQFTCTTRNSKLTIME